MLLIPPRHKIRGGVFVFGWKRGSPCKTTEDTLENSLSILIVEDDLVDRTQLERLLHRSSLSAKTTSTEYLENAIGLLKNNHFDVVLLDLNLPDSNGLDTLTTISKKNPSSSIVVTTGEGGEEMGLRAVAIGAQDYLVKGEFDTAALTKSIHYSIERKKVEEALRQERNKAKKYLDVAGVMLIVLDNEYMLNLINDKGCEILGYNQNELLEKNWCDNFVPQTHREEVKEVLKGLLSGEKEKYEYHENPVTTKDGRQRLIAWHNVPLYEEAGQIKAILSSGEDITERKQAEENLRKAYKELEIAHSEMKGMQSQLVQSEKLASIGQLAAGVAHEMNTPVGFVASNFETLQKHIHKFKTMLSMYSDMASGVSSTDMQKLNEHLEKINKAAKDMKMDFVLEDIDNLLQESKEGLTRITEIIQNLRDFSRIDQAEACDEYDINEGVKATLVVARNAIKYDADVTTEFSDVPHVRCNSGQINQVFLNILVNAAQAIKSLQKEEKGNIIIKTFSTDEHVVCTISDDGPGIPEEIINKIFDPFFTTKAAGKGTGLGLNVSYDIIVNKHKGMLLVNSTLGKGTTFTIKLPIINVENKNTNVKGIEADAEATSPVC